MAESAPLDMSSAVPLQRQKSLQGSILFMQEEHAKTLQALHQEIQRLQKRCSELTFSVAMETTSSPQEDFYREKVETLQKEFDEKSKQLQESLAVSEKKDKRINTLEQQLRAQEKKYQDLMKNKDQQLRQMKVELTDKASLNAELMLKRLSQSQENAAVFRVTKTAMPPDQDLSASAPSPGAYSPHNSHGSGSPVPPIKLPMTPHPPKDGSSHRVRRRTSPRAIVADGEPSLSTKVKSRAPSGRALRRTSTPEAVPDPAPFLQREEKCPGTGPTSTTKFDKPLPPITRRTRQSREAPQAGGVVPPQQVQSQAFVAKHKSIQKHKTAAAAAVVDQSSGSSSPEVEVLAVDTVIKRNHKLRRAQEYNTDCN